MAIFKEYPGERGAGERLAALQTLSRGKCRDATRSVEMSPKRRGSFSKRLGKKGLKEGKRGRQIASIQL